MYSSLSDEIWLEGGTVSITQWCDWGGGGAGGAHYIEMGEGTLHLKMVG